MKKCNLKILEKISWSKWLNSQNLSKKINDVKIDHWDEPKKFEIVKKIGKIMNELDHQNILKKENFVIGPNDRLYRIARHVEDTPNETVSSLKL